MSKQKYELGKRIKTIKELERVFENQEHLFFKHDKVEKLVYFGFYQNIQFRVLYKYLKLGYLYVAKPIPIESKCYVKLSNEPKIELDPKTHEQLKQQLLEIRNKK